MNTKCDSKWHLCDAAIFADIPNTVLDVYENETGKEPVPEEGGHTQDFEDWFINCVFDAWDNKDVRTIEGLVDYFKKRLAVNMVSKISYCRRLEISPEKLVGIIFDLNNDGPIPRDYIRPIAEKVVEEVAQDIYETADRENWNDDDVRLAFGRVICKHLKIEV